MSNRESIAQDTTGLDEASIQLIRNELSDESFTWSIELSEFNEKSETSQRIAIPCQDEISAWRAFDALKAA